MIHQPHLASDWTLLFKPEKHGNYVNDHTILQDRHGKWHLFGITSFGGKPCDERYFVHGESDCLTSAFSEINTVIDNGTRAWAPGAIRHGDNYYMYYGPSPTKLAISPDMNEWMDYEINLVGVPPMGCHRDHMVCKINDYTWVMYVSGIYNGYGCISCFVSNDLLNWRFVQYALTSSGDAPLTPAWGAFESPYVVHYNDMYYLFVTYTDCQMENYQNTLVFASVNPYDFGNYTKSNHHNMVVAELNAHAGEVLFDVVSNSFYITSCGWRNYNIPIEGGVAISRLDWN